MTASAGWLGLQYVGVAYVGRSVCHARGTSGVFAIVLGLLAFLYLTSVTLVICIELNVVLAERLRPHTLLAPLTDIVVLADADRTSCTDLAASQRLPARRSRLRTLAGRSRYPTRDEAGGIQVSR